MRSYSKSITLLLFASFMLLAGGGGCSHIAEAIDCDQLCENMQTCLDSDIDIDDCADKCQREVDNHELREELDACTDCLDHDYACSEAVDECSACDEVYAALAH